MMKQFFYFFALCAILLGMTSCGDGNVPESRKFNIVISKIGNTAVEMKVTATNENTYFIYDYCKSSILLISPEAFAQGKLDAKELSNFPDGLEHGNSSKKFTGLDPDEEYAFWVCEVDQDYKVVGKVEYKCVKGGVVQGEEQVNPNYAVPTGLQAEIESDGLRESTFINLTWNAVYNAAQYNVYYLHKDGQYVFYQTVSERKCTVKFMDIFLNVAKRAGESEYENNYYVLTFKVSAVDNAGIAGNLSEPVTVEVENDFP